MAHRTPANQFIVRDCTMELEAQRLSLRQKSADNKTSWLPSCGTQSGLSAPVAASNPRDDASSWRRVALRVRAGDGVAQLVGAGQQQI